MKKQIFRGLALIAALAMAAALLLALGLAYAFPGSPLLPWVCGAAGAALLAVLLLLASALSSRAARVFLRPLEELAERPDIGDTACKAYPELAPLLEKIRERQRALRRQLGELTEERDALRVITVNMQKELERQRQEFSSNVDQLRPALAALSGFGERMRDTEEEISAEEVEDLGEKVVRESARMSALLDDMLSLSRLDAAMPVSMEKVSLSAVCRETLTSLSLAAHRRSISLKLIGPEVWAKGDAGLLGELMTALCDNAIRYNHPGGSVLVETGGGADGTVRVTVKDSGIGIPEGSFLRIFDRFYQVEGRPQQIPGTGLGLAIAKRLADLHHGGITVESTLGQGSVFTVTLPVWQEEAAARKVPSAKEPAAVG